MPFLLALEVVLVVTVEYLLRVWSRPDYRQFDVEGLLLLVELRIAFTGIHYILQVQIEVIKAWVLEYKRTFIDIKLRLLHALGKSRENCDVKFTRQLVLLLEYAFLC